MNTRLEVFKGKVAHLVVDVVNLPGGPASREVLLHPGAAVVLPMLGMKDVVLLRQFRYPVTQLDVEGDGFIYELPAGLREEGESWEDCARRELTEETGYVAGAMSPLPPILLSPGISNEVIHPFVANIVRKEEQNLDEGEVLEVLILPFQKVLDMVYDGKIWDAKSIIMILHVAQFGIKSTGVSTE